MLTISSGVNLRFLILSVQPVIDATASQTVEEGCDANLANARGQTLAGKRSRRLLAWRSGNSSGGLPFQCCTDPEAGNRTEVSYRLAWARSYLKKYGAVTNSSRGVWALSKPEPASVDPRIQTRVQTAMIESVMVNEEWFKRR